MGTENCVSKLEFDAFCDEHYPPGALSKVMRSERRDMIAGWLKGIYSPPRPRSTRQNIVSRGFSLVDFPDLNLKDVLCLKGTKQNGRIEQGTYGEWRKVVCVEEFYDILLETHVAQLNHGGYRNLQKSLELNYACFSRKVVLKFVNLCSECRKNPLQQLRTPSSPPRKVIKLESITRDFNRRCQIDMLDMQLCPDGQYSYIGLYMDHWTKFVTLFPMMDSSADHMAHGLASSVYPYYGPPQFLHSAQGEEFAAKVVRDSMDKWKGGDRTVIPWAKSGLMYMRPALDRARDLLIQLINTRATNDSVQGHLPWTTWLGKIMYDINNQLNTSTGKPPYKRVFERTVVSAVNETNSSSQKAAGSGQSTSGTDSKGKMKNSSSNHESAVMTSFKSPRSMGQLKRPPTFVAIESKR
ncbi:hypothetical protein ACOMHN_008578 [Nucella lapillus]